MSTQLNYDITSDKEPLYTTVDQLNQSTAALTLIAQNSSAQAVTIKEILVELKKIANGMDVVQLLLPGSEGGIAFPSSFTGPNASAWSVTSDDGQFTFKPGRGGATFRPGDRFRFTFSNVVIREGATGTALVSIFEESDAGRGQTQAGIGIEQSTLDVKLSVAADELLIEPNGVATLKWTTNDATSGSLTLPGNSPSSITLDPATNLSSGEQRVSPVVNTTYALTCHGRGPDVMKQVTISVDSLQMSELEASSLSVAQNDEVLLHWTTNADGCKLDDGSGNGAAVVPTTVTKAQYPNGYPVHPAKPTTYTLLAHKKLRDGQSVTGEATVVIDVPPVSILSFLINGQTSDEISLADVERSDIFGVLTWEVENALSCILTCETDFPIPPQSPISVNPHGELQLEKVGPYGIEIFRNRGRLGMVWKLTCQGCQGPVEKTVEFIVHPDNRGLPGEAEI